jgi:hypothetical protein
VSAEHDGAEWHACEPWDRTAEAVMQGVWTIPVAPPPLGSTPATLVRTPARTWNGGAVGTPALVPYSFATRDGSYYTGSG